MSWAGFDEIVGIDIKPHPNYPFDFIQADIHQLPVNPFDFDFVWASPPCQKFSVALNHSNKSRDNHPNLIPWTRALLKGHPYTCIENVSQAPIRPDLILWGPSVWIRHTLAEARVRDFFLVLELTETRIQKGDILNNYEQYGEQFPFLPQEKTRENLAHLVLWSISIVWVSLSVLKCQGWKLARQ